ncbi:uncharacterized protein [Euphorbia lathyris]|uniref:uncharacterized protein n=1 Tax=Euphorbia lathyris TaxID=212925 RepID=UPI003313FF4D
MDANRHWFPLWIESDSLVTVNLLKSRSKEERQRFENQVVLIDKLESDVGEPLILSERKEKQQKDKMEVAVKTLFLGLNPKLSNHKYTLDAIVPNLSFERSSVSHRTRYNNQGCFVRLRDNRRCFSPVSAVISGAQDVEVSSSQFEEFSVRASNANENGELRISVEVSGAGTRAVFNNVFDKMVAAAQPIPGFRRSKGGKTPDIPRDVLLEVLGPSKVYKEVIKKVINSTVAEYVEKEGLKVIKDLRVEQSFEELEDKFEPDEEFSFDAIIRLQTK